METNRRSFIQAAGAAGAALFAVGNVSGDEAVASPSARGNNDRRAYFMTELFLDNHMLESTAGVSRRLHQPKKHLLNPVVQCDRWSDGTYLQPYATMYDKERKPSSGASTSTRIRATRRKGTWPWRSFRTIAVGHTSQHRRMEFVGRVPLHRSGRLRTMSPRRGTIAWCTCSSTSRSGDG
jgi:hypothetical protein